MNIYPAIDIRHARVVQLVGGDPDAVAVEAEDPAAQARKWQRAGAKRLHVVDLDGALDGRRQWQHLGAIVQTRLGVQFGGGVRSMTQIQQLLDLGVERVVVGTQGVEEPRWARELGEIFPGRVVLAVDARGREVVTNGWTKRSGHDVVETVRHLDDSGLAGFLYTNVEREGRMGGIDATVIQDLRDAAARSQLIVSGGIGSMADLEELERLGVDGAVLGMSIYTGRIELKVAVERFEGRPVPIPARVDDGGEEA